MARRVPPDPPEVPNAGTKPGKKVRRAASRETRDEQGLTELERLFAVEYLKDFNGTAAYLRARAPNVVTRASAYTNAWRMLKNPTIQALIMEERDKGLQLAELEMVDVMTKLRQCLMYDPRRIFDASGKLLPMSQWPDDVAAAVVGIEDTIAGRRVKFVDRTAALDKAMRYFGMFEKDNRQTGEAFAEVVFKVIKPGGQGA